MLIRKFREDDAAAVRRLFLRVNRELAPQGMREAFEAYIARSLQEEIGRISAYYAERDGSFWVAEESGALVGMYGLELIDQRLAEVRRMYVSPAARRRGVARAMLDHAERLCRQAGLKTLTLSTSELQVAALSLYRNSSFRLVRKALATTQTNKAVGGGLQRFYFEKDIIDSRVGE